MFIDGINFPNEIIEAIRKNNFVVFAGAGVSVDAPTSLPDFVDLAKKIAEGTGEILKEDDTCEVFYRFIFASFDICCGGPLFRIYSSIL